MDHDDRVEQALDNFCRMMDDYAHSYHNKHSEVFQGMAGDLIYAYFQWKDLAKPPGDPHKEWVDAEKMKPKAVTVLVRGSKFGDTVGLGHWGADGWHVQFFGEDQCIYKKMITHWRYIPEDDDNG